jgi:4'-phosphopantetheinyl transferase
LFWSAKEAALKVRQEGLWADTRSVEVELDLERRADGWAAMIVKAVDRTHMPGWWRRDGVFVLTIALATASEPPELLPGGAHLPAAEPTHSWVERPLV